MNEIETCKVCGKKYGVKYIVYPSNLDDKRESYYYCPYCNSNESCVRIRLRGNEDVETYKIDEN